MNRDTKQHNMLVNELTATAETLQRAVAGLQADQWNFSPTEGTWSILQNVEHVALVDEGISRLLIEKLATLPLTESQRVGQKSRDPLVTAAMFDRTTKIRAPGMATPTGRYGDVSEALAVFESARNAIVQWLETTELDLRAFGAPHPRLGLLDGKQWVLMMAAHAERHAHQILDIRKDPQFPG